MSLCGSDSCLLLENDGGSEWRESERGLLSKDVPLQLFA